MCEKILHLAQKQRRDTSEVDEAAGWARAMVEREAKGPGDLPNAMDRLERRHALPRRTLWALRYRPPKDILASVYFKLLAAYQAECERQLRHLTHEIELTRAVAGPRVASVGAAEALVDQAHNQKRMTA